MSSFLNGTGLESLLTKIRNGFIAKVDTTTVTSVGIDSAPTANSTNLVTSGGVKTAIDGVLANIPNNIVTGASTAYTIWCGTQAEYNALLTYDNNTVYLIKENA